MGSGAQNESDVVQAKELFFFCRKRFIPDIARAVITTKFGVPATTKPRGGDTSNFAGIRTRRHVRRDHWLKSERPLRAQCQAT